MPTKAEKKLAKAEAREALLKQIRRETLQREVELDQKTLKKIKDQWYETVVDTKIPQMQDNLKHILHYMEKLIEGENFRKSLFEEERQELEESIALMAQSHSSAMDNLFDIYEKRIRDLNDTFDQMVTKKSTEAHEEFRLLEQRETETQENLQTMLYQIQKNRDLTEEAMNCDMFLKLDDERSKNTEIQDVLRARLEKKMEKRWGEITATLRKYEETTRARRKDYLQLKAKDDADSKVIRQQMKKTEKLFAQLDELKRCMDECYAPEEIISQIRDLKEEKAKFLNTFKELKNIVGEELREDEVNLKTLTLATNTLIKDMKRLCRKGEQILTIYRICLRLETEMEKVLPVGELPKSHPQMARKKGRKEEKLLPRDENEEMKNERTKDLLILENFWRKVSQARISKFAITKCIQNMKKENQLLKQILTLYLKDIADEG